MSQFGRVFNLKAFSKTGLRILDTSILTVEFDIKKSLASTPNKGVISIYGLSENTRNNLRSSSSSVILSAGYTENSDVIFTGQITSADVKKQGSDIITKLEAGDGAKGQKYGSVSLTFQPETPIKTVIENFAGAMPGVKVGILKGLDGKAITDAGASYTGQARENLNKLASTYDFSWSIQDGFLETVAGNKNAPGSTIDDAGSSAYVISASTGMIGLPVVKDSGQITVKTLLNPRIKPGRVVKIETAIEKGSGFYKVSEVVLKGNYRGNEWSVSATGAPLNV